MLTATNPFIANNRAYRPPSSPVVVICLDGSSDEYIDAALVRGRMPNLEEIILTGHRGIARAAMPTFTNVNNSSIVTGVPPAIHGICGNFFFDIVTGREVMMNSSEFLRTETIFPAAARAGRKVAVVTAKEKLRDILASHLIEEGGIAFSAEHASQARKNTHGIDDVERIVGLPTPPIYSAEASLFVLRAGVALMQEGLADFLYLSTTDYLQHKFAPSARECTDFYAALDEQLRQLIDLGAVIGITADHGMSAKQKPDGSPNVIYLESLLEEVFEMEFRVILPITDPYVLHHGALGSFAVVHPPPAAPLEAVRDWMIEIPGVTEVYQRCTAAQKLELPADRLGELVVVSGRDVVLGRTPDFHNLKVLQGGLRSHGGRYEEMVPLILSHALRPEYAMKAALDVRNFDVFDMTCNGTIAK